MLFKKIVSGKPRLAKNLWMIGGTTMFDADSDLQREGLRAVG